MSEDKYCPGGCESKIYNAILRVCKKCDKEIGLKKGGIKYCPDCAKELGVCLYCGLPIKPQPKIRGYLLRFWANQKKAADQSR